MSLSKWSAHSWQDLGNVPQYNPVRCSQSNSEILTEQEVHILDWIQYSWWNYIIIIYAPTYHPILPWLLLVQWPRTKSNYLFPGFTNQTELSRCKCQSRSQRARKLMKSDEVKIKTVFQQFCGIKSFNIIVNGADRTRKTCLKVVLLSLWGKLSM